MDVRIRTRGKKVKVSRSTVEDVKSIKGRLKMGVKERYLGED